MGLMGLMGFMGFIWDLFGIYGGFMGYIWDLSGIHVFFSKGMRFFSVTDPSQWIIDSTVDWHSWSHPT